MIFRLLNWQGIAGIAVAFMLTVQKLEAVHWKKRSESVEQFYQQERAAFATTVASYRAAAETARAADQANATRVAAEQSAINERTQDFEARLTLARASAQRLRLDAKAAADPGAGGGASVPGIPAASSSAAQAPGQDRLPPTDALTATEQAIRLDELIKWVRAEAKVDNNPPAGASQPDD